VRPDPQGAARHRRVGQQDRRLQLPRDA
jgi:hypothetical protein